MKFIGRQRELESLEREYQKDSSFVVIYGRRRVGKTTLIKEFIKSKLAFYFLATEEVESQSIKPAVWCCVPGNTESVAAACSLFRLAGFVPYHCGIPAGGKESPGY